MLNLINLHTWTALNFRDSWHCPSRLGKAGLISPKDNAEKGKWIEFVT
jgi:hypothetical protein